MSTARDRATPQRRAAAGRRDRRPPAAWPRRRGGGPPWMAMGMPAEKAMNFGPSAKRLLRRLRPDRRRLVAVVALGVVSVGARR